MRVATDEFVEALGRLVRHDVARCNITLNGDVVAAGLKIESGTVVHDRRRSPRGTLNIVLAEPTLIPTATEGVLSPIGYEVVVYQGTEIRGLDPSVAFSGLLTDDMWVPLTDGSGRYILHPDGGAIFVAGRPETEELLQLGVFPIQLSGTNFGTLLTTINAYDRTQWLVDDELESDLAWPSAEGGSLEAHVQNLVRTCVKLANPDACAFRFSGEGHVCPSLVYPAGTKKWDIIERAAQGVGYEAYFDGAGDLIWQPVPNLNGEVVYLFSSSVNLEDGDVVRDRGPMINKVIAIGGSSAETDIYRGVAVDDDPLSPTRYGGPAGHKQRTIRSSTYKSDAQAQAAAEAELSNVKGIASTYNLSALPDPRLEVGDIVMISVERAFVELERAILDQITYDLSVENAMTAEGRSRIETQE